MRNAPALNKRSIDCVVIGGGPAGSVAARTLALFGATVVLLHFDHGLPRKGEVMHSSLRPLLAALQVANGFKPSVVGSSSNWSGSYQYTSMVACATGSNLLVDRQRFDQGLRASAEYAGVRLVSVIRLPQLTNSSGVWSVAWEDAAGHSVANVPLVIDCSGRRASVVRRFGTRLRFDRLLCRYYLAKGNAGDHDDRMSLLADRCGWWYSVRTDDTSRVFCRFQDAPLVAGLDLWEGMTELAPSLARIAKAFDYRPVECATFDAASAYASCNVPGLLAAGDAAFSIDPLSGQGVGSALSQGLLAGAAAVQFLRGRHSALSEFAAIQRLEFAKLMKERTSAYGTGTRWIDAPFWASRGLTKGQSS